MLLHGDYRKFDFHHSLFFVTFVMVKSIMYIVFDWILFLEIWSKMILRLHEISILSNLSNHVRKANLFRLDSMHVIFVQSTFDWFDLFISFDWQVLDCYVWLNQPKRGWKKRKSSFKKNDIHVDGWCHFVCAS